MDVFTPKKDINGAAIVFVVSGGFFSTLGVAPAEAWMAGDHLEFDVEAPQRLGLRGVWVDRPGRGLPAESTVRPDRIIRALGELTDGL